MVFCAAAPVELLLVRSTPRHRRIPQDTRPLHRRMAGNPNRRCEDARLRRGGAACLVALLLALPGCQAARQVDDAMRQVDVLDRLFEPERRVPPAHAPPLPSLPPQQAPAPPAPPAHAAVVTEPLATLPPEEPEPPALREPEPPAAGPAPSDPALRTAALLRSNPWLTHFWSGLTPAQQERVARRLQAGREPMLRTEIATGWDRMGLEERVRLLYGAGTGA
jgi:hypothetical protein